MNYSAVAMLNRWFSVEVERYGLNQVPEILYRIKVGELSREQLTRVISARYQVAHFFEDMLREMIRVVDAGSCRGGTWKLEPHILFELRKAVSINLSEELGEMKEYGGPHREGREVFLDALGVDFTSWKSRLGSYYRLGQVEPCAKRLIRRLRWIVDHGAIEAIAALWCYENRISLDHVAGEYHILLKGFEEKFPEFKKHDGSYREGDALWHIASHADHDEHHANLAREALGSLDGHLGVWHESIEFGLQETSKALDCFWWELGELFFGAAWSKAHWSYDVVAV